MLYFSRFIFNNSTTTQNRGWNVAVNSLGENISILLYGFSRFNFTNTIITYHVTLSHYSTIITHTHPLQEYCSTKKCYNDDNANLHWSLIWYRVFWTLQQLWLTFEMFYFIFLLISSNSNLHVTFPLLYDLQLPIASE